MAKQMKQGQHLNLTLKAKKADGSQGRLDGTPQWATSDPNVATVEPAADGMTAVVRSAGPGAAQISVTGDGDLGLGVRPVVGLLDVVVSESEVVLIEIEAGDPVDDIPTV